MQTHNLISNTPEWFAYRLGKNNASEAAAMIGASTKVTRDQLIAEKATGIGREFSRFVQEHILDKGHEFEKLACPLAEAIVGESLYPVTGSEGQLSASFDGLTMFEDMAWEHKRLNKALRAVLSMPGCTGLDLPMEYQIQMEQQCAVSGCAKVLFMASEWTDDGVLVEALHCWYTPNLQLRAQILAGWEQLHKDVDAYVPPAAQAAPVVGRAPDHLPALRIEVNGAVTASNLAEFKATAMAAIEGVNRVLSTDVDFADAEASVKWCAEVESRLAAAKQHALSQTVDIDALFRTMDDIAAEARRVRLELAGLVKQRKEQLRSEIVAGGVAALRAHTENLNLALGRHYVPLVPADFGGAVKGKRSIDSIQSAVNDELARAKIAASEVATRVQTNLKALHDTEGVVLALFPDVATLVLKGCDDFALVVQNRHAQHAEKELQRMEVERARIRAEEVAKVQREAEEQRERERSQSAKVEAERIARGTAEQAQAQRIRDEQMLAAALPCQSASKPKCDGDHGGPQCADPECWNGGEPKGAVTYSGAGSAVVTHAAMGNPPFTAPPPAPAAPAEVPWQDTGERINLSAINDHLAPISINAAGLALLGFEPVATVKASKLYQADDLPRIRAALVQHLQSLALQAA